MRDRSGGARDTAGAGGSGRTDDTGLPASIETAWGLRERPAKGPKPGLGLDKIVAAAVALAAAEGLGAVSMGRVARELGVATMSLYRYVAAKDELYILMQDAVAGPAPAPPAPGTGWREALTAWATEHRALFRRNPWVLRMPVSGPPVTPHSVAWWECGLAALADTGLDEGEKIGVIMLVAGFVRNEVLLSADLAAAIEAQGVGADEAMRRYERTLRRLADPERYPAVARLLESGVMTAGPSDPEGDADAEFDFGLETLLDGVDARIRRRRTAP
ncbi:TetR/AcrR family transcriptional regulator C-terminal domain-containing protein [Streptomyces sp. CAU 1734]|uniref:TetR/AcrR family transcriptional regulator n=1 Tax=Streptomyces sp. CAU 1734 TaxID=3140360 RepID=UPI00325FFEBF